MDTELVWTDQLPATRVASSSDERKGDDRPAQPAEERPPPVLCAVFSADGEALLIGAGRRVLIYSAHTGEMRQSLPGHTGTVNTISFSRDGTRFASGGADASVIIWKYIMPEAGGRGGGAGDGSGDDDAAGGEGGSSAGKASKKSTPGIGKAEGMLRYVHGTSIQSVAHNPVTGSLVSCSTEDFGIWSEDKSAVPKKRVMARIITAAWSEDGQNLALGLENGTVLIRDADGNETAQVQRAEPVWALSWVPPRDQGADVLVAGCWDGTLSYYHNTGEGTGRERRLGAYPLCIGRLGQNREYLLVGSEKGATLHTKEGVKLTTLVESDRWVWSCACHEKGMLMVLGDDGGKIEMRRAKFQMVHALYRSRYAFTESLTDVLIQHLVTDQRVRIRCRDHVRGLALYKELLAVQLPDRVNIYELNARNDPYDMHYKLQEKILQKLPCDKLLLLSQHLVLCHKHRVQLMELDGQVAREWILESPVSFIRVDGGASGREGLIVGLRNGSVQKIFAGNAFPVDVLRLERPVTCIESNITRDRLAVLDDQGLLIVHDLRGKREVFRAEGVHSVCFNTEVNDLLCYATDECVFIKTADFPAHKQKIPGNVVGFRGSHLHVVQGTTLVAVDVPQGATVHRYAAAHDYDSAVRFASLGVTTRDWRTLGLDALHHRRPDIARKALVRAHDVHLLELVDLIERGTPLRSGPASAVAGAPSSDADSGVLDARTQAEVLAYRGMFQDASKLLMRAGLVADAVRLFADLRRWDEARTLAANTDEINVRDLLLQQAEWSSENGDWQACAETLCSVQEYKRAVEVISEHMGEGWKDALLEVVRNIPRHEKDVLTQCGDIFSSNEEDDAAREVYEKMEDWGNLMALCVRKQNWTEAIELAKKHEGEFDRRLFLPYAEWLAFNDRFDEALEAFRNAGRPDLSRKMLRELTYNAVVENRFKDASYYYWLLSREVLESVKRHQEEKGEAGARLWGSEHEKERAEFAELVQKADLYYAYQHVHATTHGPFTNLQPEMLLQVSRYILNTLGNRPAPYGISQVNTLYCLAKQAKALGAHKLARFAYERLQVLKVPEKWLDALEMDMLTIQATPVRDLRELLPVCYRCGATNPLLNPFTSRFSNGDVCTNCGHPFIRSFVSFEVLPLVQFHPDPSITDEEAQDMIRAPPTDKGGSAFGASGGGGGGGRRGDEDSSWTETKEGDADMLRLDSDNGGDAAGAASAMMMMSGSDGTGGGSGAGGAGASGGGEGDNGNGVNAQALLALRREEVMVCQPPIPGMRATFFRNMLPEITVAVSQPCQRFFTEEEFEFAYLKDGRCPYSRVKDVGDYGSL